MRAAAGSSVSRRRDRDLRLSQSIDRGKAPATAAVLALKHKFDLICSNGSLEIAPSLRRLLPMLVEHGRGRRLPCGRISERFVRAEPRADANDRRRRAVGEDASADRQDAAIQRNDGRPLCAAQSDLRHCRHLGSDLPPRHGERRGGCRVDGGDKARALPDRAERRRIVASFSIAMPTNCARPIRLCRTAEFCCGRGDSSYWRSRNATRPFVINAASPSSCAPREPPPSARRSRANRGCAPRDRRGRNRGRSGSRRAAASVR